MPIGVLVAGMHRGGTSATAGALHLLGLALGRNLMPPSPANTKGYWENNDVVAIHEALLTALNHGWDDVRPLPPGWAASEAASVARDSLRHWLSEELSGADLWAVKDPRLCRLIPLWLDVLQDLNTRPAVLVVVRDPVEVAASIRARDGWPEEIGHALWLRHLAEVEIATRNVRRCAVMYDQLLASPVETLTAASDRLGLNLSRRAQEMAPQLEAFVDAKERHQVSSDLDQCDGLQEIIRLNRQIYRAMVPVCENDRNWDQVGPLLVMACRFLQHRAGGLLALADRMAAYRREVSQVRAECADAQSRRAQAEAEAYVQIRSLTGEVASLRCRIHAAEGELRRMTQSRSWRLTAPLRWANGATMRLRGFKARNGGVPLPPIRRSD